MVRTSLGAGANAAANVVGAGYISEHWSATTNRGGSVTEQSISRLLGSSRAAFALRCETNGAEQHGRLVLWLVRKGLFATHLMNTATYRMLRRLNTRVSQSLHRRVLFAHRRSPSPAPVGLYLGSPAAPAKLQPSSVYLESP